MPYTCLHSVTPYNCYSYSTIMGPPKRTKEQTQIETHMHKTLSRCTHDLLPLLIIILCLTYCLIPIFSPPLPFFLSFWYCFTCLLSHLFLHHTFLTRSDLTTGLSSWIFCLSAALWSNSQSWLSG